MSVLFSRYPLALLAVFSFAVLLPAQTSRFNVPPTYTVGLQPNAIASGDFNGDGKPDLAIATNGSAPGLTVLISNGDGTFQAPVTYSIGGGFPVLSIAIADFNGDGKLDVVIGKSCCTGGVVVFLGNGDGTFQAAVSYATAGQSVPAIAVADFNGDGKLDLSSTGISQNGTGKAEISVELGNGDGTFQPPITTDLTYYGGSYDTLVAGDFNKDSKSDVAVLVNSQLLLLLGNGDGTFKAPVDLHSETNSTIAVGDMNHDGNLDLVTVGDHGVLVFLGNGNATFKAPVENALPIALPHAIALADLNGDGKLDVVVAGSSPSAVQVLLGTGTGTLGKPVIYAIGGGPSEAGGVVAADFNGDGYPDVVPLNYGDETVSVLLGSKSGALQSIVVAHEPLGPMVTGNFNGDGFTDLAGVLYGSNEFKRSLGYGNGTLGSPEVFKVGSGAFWPVAADFNGDGHLDIATANQLNISLAFGNGNGVFQPTVSYGFSFGLGNPTTYLAAVDANGDGKPDLGFLTQQYGLGTVGVMLNAGDGTFLPATTYSSTGSISAVAFGDFNGDGKVDMVTTDENTPGRMGIFLGNGDGTFAPRIDHPFGLHCYQAIAADVNGDGKLDVVLACGSLAVMLGNGDGTFQDPIFNPLLIDTLQIAAADINGDGILDFVAAGGDLGVYYGNGDGTFSYTSYGLEAKDVAVGDFNGDGLPDIAVYNGVGPFVLLNTGEGSSLLVGDGIARRVAQNPR